MAVYNYLPFALAANEINELKKRVEDRLKEDVMRLT
jgi:hypothetical protein